MACVDELHIDDQGTSIEFLIKECGPDGTKTTVDISAADSITVRFQKSDTAKTTVDRTGVIYTDGANGDGTDGIVQYITESGLVDIKGTWKAQAIVGFPDGGLFHSSIVEITVVSNLKAPL